LRAYETSVTTPTGTTVETHPGKTLWDWMDLLLVPSILALGGLWFNRQERTAERERADERRREDALQNYLDQMTVLLIDKKLRTSEREEKRDIARTRTLTVLRELDRVRKGMLVQFLTESDLIKTESPVVYLGSADLSGANLSGVSLSGANLERAVLRGADLIAAVIDPATQLDRKWHLVWQIVNGEASLGTLAKADLSGANLSGADLIKANLGGADLTDADLRRAKLTGADLRGADLRGADLREAYLFRVDLREADLRGADLRGAEYSEATIWPDGFNPEAAGAEKNQF
jgi:uncharacterized protein YjbI with pentapeptide repeats